MNVLVVYESIYGNTRQVAGAVASGLGARRSWLCTTLVWSVAEVDVVEVSASTHMYVMATSGSRPMAAVAAKEDGHTAVEPGAASKPGLPQWLRDPADRVGARAAAFETPLDRSPMLTGMAARGIGRRLRHRGYKVVGSKSFLLEDAEGPFEEGELVRVRASGEQLARQLSAV